MVMLMMMRIETTAMKKMMMAALPSPPLPHYIHTT